MLEVKFGDYLANMLDTPPKRLIRIMFKLVLDQQAGQTSLF